MCLRELGHTANLIYSPNWCAYKNSSMELADKIRDKMDESPVDCLVLTIISTLPCPPAEMGFQSRREKPWMANTTWTATWSSVASRSSWSYSTTSGQSTTLPAPKTSFSSGHCGCGDEEDAANTKLTGFEKQLARGGRQLQRVRLPRKIQERDGGGRGRSAGHGGRRGTRGATSAE
jgi:hypothetical protein